MKPLGAPAYGSIPHLPGSRLGPKDRTIHQGQAQICTERVKHRGQFIIVQEKLDGSCCAVACLDDGEIVALGRSGYTASSSRFEQHQLFATWVREREPEFRSVLRPGERLVGEWLAQAHATRYHLGDVESLAPFDFMVGARRKCYIVFNCAMAKLSRFIPKIRAPRTVMFGVPVPVDEAYAALLRGCRDDDPWGHVDPPEGLVYRVERGHEVEFLAKWVRPDKVDGCFLPEISGGEAVWNWRPTACV